MPDGDRGDAGGENYTIGARIPEGRVRGKPASAYSGPSISFATTQRSKSSALT